ncbi:GMF family protein [Colletotrichum musicola]|uniref:GMF family protein n=2 Tax=Colletotrichum orchidearum species complex TaxID=2707337 RepID=A0A8H6KFR6_9PEZI|nr:GMF family protein [Colletotrichum musicola]KAF6833009.1 GMF family protein [Colletotrichum plurivorum]
MVRIAPLRLPISSDPALTLLGGSQASESRLYTFSQETKDHLRKFRLGTSRSNDAQAVIYYIDKNTHEIKQDDDKVVYKSLEEIGDDLPDHSPRFVLLSYPLTLPSGRLSVPYVLIYYLPITCNNEIRMLYAGAKELMRNTSEVGRVIDIQDVEDLEEIPAKLGAA